MSSISGERKRKSLSELEKKESKKLKSCQKIIKADRQEPSLSVQSTGRARVVQI